MRWSWSALTFSQLGWSWSVMFSQMGWSWSVWDDHGQRWRSLSLDGHGKCWRSASRDGHDQCWRSANQGVTISADVCSQTCWTSPSGSRAPWSQPKRRATFASTSSCRTTRSTTWSPQNPLSTTPTSCTTWCSSDVTSPVGRAERTFIGKSRYEVFAWRYSHVFLTQDAE